METETARRGLAAPERRPRLGCFEDLAEHPRWSGLEDEDHVGAPGSLSSGDFDGDGFTDFAIGARDADVTPGDDRAGAVHVVQGRAGLFPATNTLQDAATTIVGVLVDDQVNFGAAVAGVGDMDSDGFDDLLVGGPNHDAGQDPGESEVGAAGCSAVHRRASRPPMPVLQTSWSKVTRAGPLGRASPRWAT